MKISFILPCYNVEQYVRKCVESIINLEIDQYEIIAVDDGSTDQTRTVLTKLQEEYDITLITHNQASGYAGRPRNSGLDIAEGEYVAFLDPDDYYIGNGIKQAYEAFKGYDVIVNSFHICNPEGKVTDKVILKNKDVRHDKYLWRQIVNVCNQRTLFKRKFLVDNKIRFYEDCRSQDLLFLYATYVAGARMRLTNIVTTMYLDERTDSVSNVISRKYIETSILAYERFFHLIENKLPTKEVESAIGEHFLGYYLTVRNKLTDDQKEMLFATDFYKYLRRQVAHKK